VNVPPSHDAAEGRQVHRYWRLVRSVASAARSFSKPSRISVNWTRPARRAKRGTRDTGDREQADLFTPTAADEAFRSAQRIRWNAGVPSATYGSGGALARAAPRRLLTQLLPEGVKGAVGDDGELCSCSPGWSERRANCTSPRRGIAAPRWRTCWRSRGAVNEIALSCARSPAAAQRAVEQPSRRALGELFGLDYDLPSTT